MAKAFSGSAAEDGAGLAVAGDSNVGNISSSSLRWSLVFPRCASTLRSYGDTIWASGSSKMASLWSPVPGAR